MILTEARPYAKLLHADPRLSLRRLRRQVRAACARRAEGDLPPLLGQRARASYVGDSAPRHRWKVDRPQPARPAARRVLRGKLRISLALTGRLARLRERLANREYTADNDPSLLWAAVAVVLTPDPDSILLIRRAERAGDPWSGHMALPGGRREPGDQDLIATAVREIAEEVGIELAAGNLVGQLADVVPRTPVLPPIAVRPLVFLPPGRPSLMLNSEVASAHWVRLDDLLKPGSHHAVWLEVAGQSREVQAYQLEDAMVWGMTERILTDLLHQLRD